MLINARLEMNDGTLTFAFRNPMAKPENAPIAMTTGYVHQPSAGARLQNATEEIDATAPMDRSVLPSRIMGDAPSAISSMGPISSSRFLILGADKKEPLRRVMIRTSAASSRMDLAALNHSPPECAR